MNKDAEFLKNSLLFQMSLGSKELYHSNVWAWLIDNNSKFLRIFFPDISPDNYVIEKTERECHNRDVLIRLKEKTDGRKYYLTIENKIKTLPDRRQLEKYTEDLDNATLLGAVYTGITNPLGEVKFKYGNGEISWNFIGYDTIAKRLGSLLSTDDLHYGQICEYRKILESINSLLKNAVDKAAGKLNYNFGENDLYDLRINDLAIKLKAADFMAYCKEKGIPKPENYESDDFRLWTEQSFHNGNATIDFRLTNWKDYETPFVSLGIQIQGNQYRFIAERDKSFTCEQVFAEFGSLWFEKCKKSRSMRGEMCKYETKNYSFVYVYETIDETNNSYDTLIGKIRSDLDAANSILKRHRTVSI